MQEPASDLLDDARVAWHNMMSRRQLRKDKEEQITANPQQGAHVGRSDPEPERSEVRKRREAYADADREKSSVALPVRETVAAAARAGSRHVWRILAAAFLVSIATALVEIAVNNLIDRTNVPLAILGALSAAGVSILGTVFLSGFLCRLVGETEHGKERTSVKRVLGTLPWLRLAWADILVALLVVIGLIALVIPGLVAINLFAVVGPVIEIEDRPVIAALRRSAHLVRRHFWKVALLATLPVILASEIDNVGPGHPTTAGAILEALAIRGLAEAVVEAGIGLMLVELAYRLIALDRSAPDRP